MYFQNKAIIAKKAGNYDAYEKNLKISGSVRTIDLGTYGILKKYDCIEQNDNIYNVLNRDSLTLSKNDYV